MTTLLALFLVLLSLRPPPLPDGCFTAYVSGYLRSERGDYMFDGTPTDTEEPIAAAGAAIPLGSTVTVEGLGSFRVADRGSGLFENDIDIAAWSKAEVYDATGRRRVCYTEPTAPMELRRDTHD